MAVWQIKCLFSVYFSTIFRLFFVYWDNCCWFIVAGFSIIHIFVLCDLCSRLLAPVVCERVHHDARPTTALLSETEATPEYLLDKRHTLGGRYLHYYPITTTQCYFPSLPLFHTGGYYPVLLLELLYCTILPWPPTTEIAPKSIFVIKALHSSILYKFGRLFWNWWEACITPTRIIIQP